MFDAREQPVDAIQEVALVMKFVNDVMSKMRSDEKLSGEAMLGLQCLLSKIEKNLSEAGEELTTWRKVSGAAGSTTEHLKKVKDAKA